LLRHVIRPETEHSCENDDVFAITLPCAGANELAGHRVRPAWIGVNPVHTTGRDTTDGGTIGGLAPRAPDG